MQPKSNEKGIFELTVKAVIVTDDGKVLVLKRPEHEKSGAGKYDLPGGGIAVKESIEEALRREIAEETGIEAEIGPVVYAFDFDQENYRTTNDGKGLRYLAYYRGGEVKLDDKEHQEYEWLPIAEAIERFSDKGFEKDKRQSLINAQKYLELEKSSENWKRCLADFENYKRRQAESQKELREYAKEDILLQLLPVADNFHASTDHVPEDQKESAWVVGIMYIQKQLGKLLEDNGAQEIKVQAGDKFDPEIHEAVSHGTQDMEHGTEKSEDKIKKIISKGYRLGGKVIRAAKVIVD